MWNYYLLKTYRIKAGKTQEEMAPFFGVTPSSYSRIENGKQAPDIEALLRFMQDHELDAIDLLPSPFSEG